MSFFKRLRSGSKSKSKSKSNSSSTVSSKTCEKIPDNFCRYKVDDKFTTFTRGGLPPAETDQINKLEHGTIYTGGQLSREKKTFWDPSEAAINTGFREVHKTRRSGIDIYYAYLSEWKESDLKFKETYIDPSFDGAPTSGDTMAQESLQADAVPSKD